MPPGDKSLCGAAYVLPPQVVAVHCVQVSEHMAPALSQERRQDQTRYEAADVCPPGHSTHRCLAGLLLTSLGLVSAVAQVERRLFFVEIDALLILLGYAGAMWLLFSRGIVG